LAKEKSTGLKDEAKANHQKKLFKDTEIKEEVAPSSPKMSKDVVKSGATSPLKTSVKAK
jgi:hypothetical protein